MAQEQNVSTESTRWAAMDVVVERKEEVKKTIVKSERIVHTATGKVSRTPKQIFAHLRLLLLLLLLQLW